VEDGIAPREIKFLMRPSHASADSRFSSLLFRMRMGNWFSLRFQNAWMGAIGVLMIVLGITMAPVVASLGIMPTTILFLLLSPAMLIALYSLFFEQSKFYGILGCALIGVAVLIQPLAWYWAKLCVPEGVAFVAFCLVISALRGFGRP
jgi:hypothetical protein